MLDKDGQPVTTANDGVKIFELAGTAPREADAIDLVSGELRRAWSCAVGGLVPELHEEGYVQRDAARYAAQAHDLISRASAKARGAIAAVRAVRAALAGTAGRGLLARRRGR